MHKSPSRLAFVVKLSPDAEPAHLAGRVEHVGSGESARFEAIEELGSFLAFNMIDIQIEEGGPNERGLL